MNSNWNSAGKFFTLGGALTLALAIAPTMQASDKGCTVNTLRGSYSQIGTGVVTAPPDQAGPFANVGTLIFDGKGGVTGSITVSSNGNTAQATEVGTYTVNEDCTGTYSVQIAPFGITSNAYFAIDTNGDQVEIITTDPGSVITCVARRLFPGRAI